MLSLPQRWRNFIEDKILNNWQYKLSALAAAFIIWTYVAGQQSMQAVYTIPIYFQNLPVGSILADPKVQKIQVTISGRRDRILSLKERQIWVAIKLSGMHIGKNVYQLTKQDIITPAGIEVKNFSPRKLTIRLIKAEQSKAIPEK